MKKIVCAILTVSALLLGACGADNNGKLRITGNLEGTLDSVAVGLYDADKRDISWLDTVAVKDGKFEAEVALDRVGQVYLFNLGPNTLGGQMMIYAVPGETCELTGSWSNEYFINGSAFYKEYNELDQQLSPIQREHQELVQRCTKMMESGVNSDSVMAIYNAEAEAIQERMTTTQMDFIRQRPKSEVCATILPNLTPEKANEAYELMDKSVREGRMLPIIEPAMKQAEKALERIRQAENVAEGKPALDFTLNDLNGKPLALSSLRGKYVVLDFWGSWCGWCIKGIPDMKKYYQKYSDKMEILGIDCNDSEEDWKAAVKKHEMPWLHVYNTEEADVTAKYAIEGFPTKIVVDPDGKIAKVVVGEDPAFYTYLDELFK